MTSIRWTPSLAPLLLGALSGPAFAATAPSLSLVTGSNGSQINNVGVDFIREVNIKSSAFSAEFGRNSGSNVNVVQELVSMIQAQRAYELNSKVIQTADQMLQTTNQVR